MNEFINKIDTYSAENLKNKMKNELIQISAIKLKILHSIQRIIMFDEEKEEIFNNLTENFDLLQIKETFLKENIDVSVENFFKTIIFKLPYIFKISSVLKKILADLEIVLDESNFYLLNNNNDNLVNIIDCNNKSLIILENNNLSRRRQEIRIGNNLINCNENLCVKKQFNESSKIISNKIKLEENLQVTDFIFDFDDNFHIFQHLYNNKVKPQINQSIRMFKVKSEEDKMNSKLQNHPDKFNKNPFKFPEKVESRGINGRLALNIKYIPTLKTFKIKEKNKLCINLLRNHIKEFDNSNEKFSHIPVKVNDFSIKDKNNGNIDSNICQMSSQKSDVLAFSTPLDLNFLKSKRKNKM